jgi:hypothetical protein
MKHYLTLITIFFSLILNTGICALADETPELEIQTEQLKAIIAAKDFGRVNSEFSFDASHSHNPFPERPVIFEWNFGDNQITTGKKVTHIFKNPGTFEVKLTMRSGADFAEQNLLVFVFERAILAMTDDNSNKKITMLTATAREQNILLQLANKPTSLEKLFTGGNLISTIFHEKTDFTREAEKIILLQDDGDGLLGLAQFTREAKPPIDFTKKTIVLIAEGNLDTLAKLARGIFTQIKPKEILLTRPEALRKIIFTKPDADLAKILEEQGIEVNKINSNLAKFKWSAPLSFWVNYLITKGIPADVILLVLLLPVIATLVAFLKQVVGITTFGVYTPAMLTLSFLIVGLKLGIIILLAVVLASVLTRKILRKYRLAYTPRLAIVLTAVALAIFAAIVLVTWLAPLGNYMRAPDLISISIFPILVMSTLAEKFVSLQTEKGSRSAVRLFFEALLVAVFCYLIVGKWEYLRTLILVIPEIIFLFLLADVILGRFTGLRVSEYFRFWEVIKKVEE